jgi:hypothetical protein
VVEGEAPPVVRSDASRRGIIRLGARVVRDRVAPDALPVIARDNAPPRGMSQQAWDEL